MIVRKTAGRLRSRFNFSVSEIGHQELLQRAWLGAVSIGPDRIQLERISNQLIGECERILGDDLLRYSIEIFDHD